MKPDDDPQPQHLGDPYLQWTRATRFRGHAAFKDAPDAALPLLLQLKNDGRVAAVQGPGVGVAPAYLRPGAYGLRFCTAWAQEAALRGLHEGTEAMAMSLPLRLPQTPNVAPLPDTLRREPREAKASLVIGVIDKHCAFLNHAFRKSLAGPGRLEPRLLGLWEQGRPAELAAAGQPQLWRTPADFGYGRELTADEIRTLLPGLASGQDEQQVYRAQDYLQDGQGNLSQATHGTHVLDIAAGLVTDPGLPASAKPAHDDEASRAALLFVDVPEPGEGDSTGASADAYILDALHYILLRAGAAARVVVNLSVGALAGSHDGQSLIEQAIAELLAHNPQLAITVAAGNSAEERWHASGMLPGPSGETRTELLWRTIADDATDSFMELWFSAAYASALQQLKLTLEAPDPAQTLTVRLGEARVMSGAAGPQASLDFLPQKPRADGQARAMALVSLAPACGARAGQPGGAWRMVIDYEKGSDPCTVDAWLQRDTPGRPLEPVQQSFIDATDPVVLKVSGWDAVSSLASGQRTVVVGAARASDGTRSPYSPSKVHVFGAADEDAANPGLICSGALSGSFFRMSGTSAAAPAIARRLACANSSDWPGESRPVQRAGRREPGG